MESALKTLAEAPLGDAAPAGSETTPTPTPSGEAPAAAAPGIETPAAPAADPEDLRADADIQREAANMSSPHRAAFTKLRYEARDLKRQLKAAQEALDTAKAAAPAVGAEATPELQTNYEVLKKEHEAAKAKLSQFEQEAYSTRLELTEEFQKTVMAPRQEIAQGLASIAERYQASAEAVVDAVRSGDPEKISRITADMSEFDRYKFYQGVEKFQDTIRVEGSMRADSKATLEGLLAKRRGETEAQENAQRSEWGKAAPAAWDRLVESFPAIAPVEGDAEWNEKVEAVKGYATPERFGKLTTQEKAEVLQRAAAFPVLAAELEAAMKFVSEAQEKLSRYDRATPGVGAGDAEAAPATGGVRRGFVSSAVALLKKAS